MKGEQCFHCGEPLPTKPNLFDNKSFCCNGCVQVYKLLSESGLDGVYENEGFLPTANQKLEDYSYLDQAEIQKALIRYEKEGVKVVSFELPNIHCASCLFVLEAMPSWQDGIKRVDVQFSSRRAIIYFDPNSLKLSEVASRLHQIGYPIHLNLDNTEKAPDGSRRYIAPMAVAGFCFGNIMMFSLPEYLGLDNLDHGEYGHLFRYLSMLLTFPVMFYAANVWHKSAFEALKRKAITIDLPIVAGIWVLFLRSIYEVVALHQPGFFDSLAGLVFFLLIGKWYQQKTFDRLSFDKSFTAFLPLAVKVFDKDENIVSKSAAGIEKGDELFIRHGEIIPVDGELISETADINYSFITGESLPEQIKSGDQIFAGGSVHGKAIRVKALRKVEESYLHALWDSQKSGVKSTFQNMTDSISANFSAAILIIAAVGALIWLPFDASKSAMVFTAVLIVACPCALALAAPFSMGSGIRSLAKR
ncbi:MAG: heavy metal translocating P-type ATPase metal-binding domain-containing protein, partial [Cryomorphaceae bacterium]|nr:heavy metal translocating P-type ATPase metal-binding domain-containing protein [Cryomorphaceae bacterium]